MLLNTPLWLMRYAHWKRNQELVLTFNILNSVHVTELLRIVPSCGIARSTLIHWKWSNKAASSLHPDSKLVQEKKSIINKSLWIIRYFKALTGSFDYFCLIMLIRKHEENLMMAAILIQVHSPTSTLLLNVSHSPTASEEWVGLFSV